MFLLRGTLRGTTRKLLSSTAIRNVLPSIQAICVEEEFDCLSFRIAESCGRTRSGFVVSERKMLETATPLVEEI